MKVAKSCSQCRAAKRKCTAGIPPQPACTQCVQKGLSCSLLLGLSSNRQKPLAPAVAAPDYSERVSDKVRDQLVDVYLQLIHDKPHTLFHPETLKSRVQSGSLPEAVLFSILALAARFSSDPMIQARVKDFYQTAKESFKRALDEVTIDNIHATALIGNICGADGDPTGESLFFGISFRMAQILRLPEPSPEDDGIMRETKLRTYWSLYMIDQWSSAGLDMPRQIPDTSQHPLPMLELEFWQLRPGEQARGSMTRDRSPGLWGYMVILARIFGKIHELHRQLANGSLTDTETEEQTRVLALELEGFAQSLPSTLELTSGNLEHHAMLGLGATFVALHLGYHHYSTLLYFHYLDSTLTQVPNQALFAARCKYHAVAFSDLLSSSNEIPSCEALYFIVGHMTVISSSALLHTLLFGEPEELPDTRRRLYSNFQVLLKLKQYWSDVKMMITRLFTFQEACMRSTDQVYIVDKWIVKFLLQHALPIEKNLRPPFTQYLAERDRFAEDALAILRPAEHG
ncbi:hypothetical protein BDW59DRAFT_11268 [Aspergillus cavernicola]|uniref:Zn(2)-C6 fungal-type domain-containing protein n=1 Tax=Aspergillus cavernicola TaxID=176166 RepID=A0ABR4HLG2_9EURO